MPKYKVTLEYPDGEEEVLDDLYDSREEAEEDAAYNASCYRQGGEILRMSNPGDDDEYDDEGSVEWSIEEVED